MENQRNVIQTSPPSRPLVYDYADYRAFLKHFYDWKKSTSDFSHARFASAAGFKSRSFLRLVLTGRRNLSDDGIVKFIMGLELSKSEGEAFGALVRFNQAGDFNSRLHYWEAFLKLKPKGDFSRKIRDEYKYLARLYYPVLLIILRQPHVSHDLENLAKLTGMTAGEVKEGLETLKGLGVLEEKFPGRFFVTENSLATSDDTPNIAKQTFHRNMLKLAQESTELPPHQREFQSVMFALNRDEFLLVKRRLRELADELDRKFAGKREKSQQVFALNLNLIPLTPQFHPKSENPESSSQNSEVTASPRSSP